VESPLQLTPSIADWSITLLGFVVAVCFGWGWLGGSPDPSTGFFIWLTTVVYSAHLWELSVWGRTEAHQLLHELDQGVLTGPALGPGLSLWRRSVVELDGERFAAEPVHAMVYPQSPYIERRFHLPGWLAHGQSVLVVLGLLGTFWGLTAGLLEGAPALANGLSDPAVLQAGMAALLGGARLAFAKSIAALLASVAWMYRYHQAEAALDEAFDRGLRRYALPGMAVAQLRLAERQLRSLQRIEAVVDPEGRRRP
jgi:hypothetical protein